MLAAILVCGISFTSCDRADNPSGESTVTEFQYELDQALSWAQVYGPPTQTLAEEVAARHKGMATPLNYKTRESTERKCITDNSSPFELKDLARTTVLCEYDSIRKVIDDVTATATERGIFGRYKHQTSDRGYRPRLCRLNKRKRQLHTASFLFTLSTELLRLPDTIGRSQK